MTASAATTVRPVAIKEQRVPRLRQAWTVEGYSPAATMKKGFGRRAAGSHEVWYSGRTRRSVGQQTVSSLPPFLAAPHARLAWRLRNFATKRHEQCGLKLFFISSDAAIRNSLPIVPVSILDGTLSVRSDCRHRLHVTASSWSRIARGRHFRSRADSIDFGLASAG